jgi:YadA-like membrane anchor domain
MLVLRLQNFSILLRTVFYYLIRIKLIMKTAHRSNRILKALFVLAGLTAIGGQVQAGTDNIGTTTTSNASPQAVTAPTTGTVTFTATGPGLAGPTNFVYDFAARTWAAPTGWTAIDRAKGIFIDGQGHQITFASVNNSIAAGTATTPTTPNSSTISNVAVNSSILGASSANGSVASLGQTSQPFTVAVSPNSGYATAQYIVQDITTNPPATVNTSAATAGISTGWTNPVLSAPASVQPSVTVQSNTGPYQTGSYTVATNGSVSGTATQLSGSALTFSTVAGSAVVNSNGSVTANVTATPVTSISASGISTGGTLAVTGATTLTGALSANGGTTTTTLNVTGASTTNGITNTGNISTTTLNVTGASTTNGITNTGNISTTTLNSTGNTSVGGALAVTGASTTNGITNTGNISTTTLNSTSNTSVGGALAVTGASTTNGISNTGNISNSGAVNTATLNTTGNASVGGALAVTGASTTNGISNTGNISNSGAVNTATLNTTGNAAVGGTLAVTGGTTTHGINNSMSQISGVADGTSTNDAVNYGQLQDTRKLLSRGIASVTAMANIPAVDQGKTFSVGMGVGSFDSNTAVALGASYRVAPSAVLRASVAGGSGGKTAFGVGVGGSW